MEHKSKLSVCIATYNEAHNIKQCLESVYTWVDEIILVDGRSTDDTVKIAKSLGNKVKVYLEDNPPLFHINKQKALEKATSEWILQLDADEEVSMELKKEIVDIINPSSTTQYQKSVNGYWIPRLNYFLGRPLKKGGQYPDYTIRLYKNGLARLPCKSVHEQAEVTGEVGYLKHSLMHYPYPTFSEYIKKWDRYCDLEAELLYKHHTKLGPSLWLEYFIFKPLLWFLSTYFRHKGFMDGFPGYVFAFFSAHRFWLIYIKLYEKKYAHAKPR